MAIASLPETASSLLEPPKLRPSSLKFHPLFRSSLRPQFPFRNHQPIRLTAYSSLHTNLRTLATRYATSQSTDDDPSNPFEKLQNVILKTLNSLKKPAIAAILLGVIVLGDPYSALAASGGRIGGSSFSSRSSRSSSSPSWSYSAPAPSYSRSFYSAPFYSSPFVPMGPVVSFGFGAGSNFLLVMMGFMAFLFLTGFLSDSSEGSVLTETQKTSVIKLQV
jgi:hypothetical protein